MFSFARQQKYNFCPRAFYFRYSPINEGFAPELQNKIDFCKAESIRETSETFFLIQLAKEIFNLRLESDFRIRKLIYREGRKLNLSEKKLSITFESLKNFIESDFYQLGNPSLVNALEVEGNPRIQIGDKEVTGGVHAAWLDSHGKFFVVRFSPKGAEVNTSFAALWAVKKYRVLPENLNIGALSTRNWNCSWKSIDWHEISELQDMALSFKEPESFSECQPTKNISHCELCEFNDICYNHSSELDLI